MVRLMLAASLALSLVAAGSCKQGDGVLAGEGTVHQGVAPECPAIWRVDSDDGRMLWPVEDPAFQKEGLRVRFTARATGGMTICQAGTTVEFLTLRRL